MYTTRQENNEALTGCCVILVFQALEAFPRNVHFHSNPYLTVSSLITMNAGGGWLLEKSKRSFNDNRKSEHARGIL